MSSMIEFYPSPWRHQFERALDGVRDQLIIATPFIKKSEAEYVCNRLLSGESSKKPYVRVITDLRTESVLGGSLDMDALKIFQNQMSDSEIITLPHLHAKVYIFDTSLAVVGSANLTRSGLDSNYEYSVGIREPILVNRIKTDIDAYARIGNILHPSEVEELSQVAEEISAEYRNVQRSAAASAKRQFDERLKSANVRFAEALVGTRSAHGLFSEAILYVLSHGPLPTRHLHPQVQQLLPDLCDDSAELIISGKRFGKAWKHHVRNAQQNLKRRGLIALDDDLWHLVSSNE
jgi:phosphatidylserine/phosphatidylglycerophosphate/cardiolipin synthase-like enzyme